MLLATSVFLTALGFTAWILGSLFDYTGFAVIGGTVVVIVGATAMTDGIDRKVGEVHENVTASETQISYEYEPIQTADRDNFGLLVMLLGALQVFHGLNAFE